MRDAARGAADRFSQEIAARYVEYIPTIDVRELLPQVNAPALLFHARHDPVTPLSAGQQLVAALPHARLVVLEEPDPHVVPDQEKMLALITGFLDGVKAASQSTARRRTDHYPRPRTLLRRPASVTHARRTA